MTPPTGVLGVACSACRLEMSITYEMNGQHGGLYRLQKWQCPECGGVNSLNLSGRILDVATIKR